MYEEEFAIVRALVPVAWADGHFADKEREMLEGLLDAYGANEQEKQQLREYANEKRTLDDINLQDLSADDRRVLLQHAVLLCHVDGDFSDSEKTFLDALSTRLKIPAEEAKSVIAHAAERAKKHLKHL